MKPKILGILASPSPTGGSAQLLYAALKCAEINGAKVEVIHLYNNGEIKCCIGCITDSEPNCKFPCIFEDYGKEILIKLRDSDGAIFATPVYWFNVSSMLKSLFERMTCLEHMIAYGQQSYLEGKVVAAIAVGADSGVMSTISYILTTLNGMGAILPPWAMAYSHKAKEALYDDKALMDAINVGTLVAKTIKLLKHNQPVELKYENNHKMLNEVRIFVEKLIQKFQQGDLKNGCLVSETINSEPLNYQLS